MTEQQLQQINDKLFELLRTLTPPQAQWLESLQSLEVNPAAPEEVVFETVVAALRVGIRSSTARLLIVDQLAARGISLSLKKVTERSWAAKQYYENLGKQPQAPIPPLVISAGERKPIDVKSERSSE